MRTTADIAKAKQIIQCVLEEAGGVVNGKLRLNKAFYFAHLYHYRDREGVLSDYPMIRMPRGPAIDRLDGLVASLADDGVVQVAQRRNGPYDEKVFSLRDGAAPAALTDHERASVREAWSFVKDKTTSELSDLSHNVSWEETRDGQVQNIYADLLDDSDFEEMKLRQLQIKDRFHAALRRR